MESIRHKILLIEDDELDQMAFKRLTEYEELPYDCTIAGSVSEAQSILDSKQFDIVIADYLLGDGTAFDILDSVKNTPVIFVTGAGDEEIAVKAWKAGAYDYLVKDHERNYLKTVPITVENAIKHKRIEARLRLLSHAIVSTDDSVYITDLEDRITFVNRAFCETYGYQEEEVIGKDSNILWKESPLSTGAESTYQAVGGWEVGFYHKRKDGSEFPVSLTRSEVRDENGNEVALVVIARNISERMYAENEFRALNQKLEKQNRLKRELAIAVCHRLEAAVDELKNNISNAIMSAPGRTGSKDDNLELADKNIDRVREIVSNFLDISQVDADKMELDLTELGLRSVVSQVLKALAPLAAKGDIDLEGFMPDSELVIDPNWDRIVRVLTDLVSKATSTVAAGGTGRAGETGTTQ